MVNYNNSSIYKLCCLDTDIKEIYIGSTTNFKRRKCQHKCNCNNENNKKYHLNVYQFIRANGGWENFDMVEIEKMNCKDKRELHTKEREYIEKYDSKLNKHMPYRTDVEKKEYYQTHIDTYKEYRIKNKDYIIESQKKYYQNNKKLCNEKCKQYRVDNKDKISEKRKEKIECECGLIVIKDSIARHKRTNKHKKIMDI